MVHTGRDERSPTSNMNYSNVTQGVRLSTRVASATVNFFDCIDDFFKSDVLDSENKLRCQSCKMLNRSQIRFRVKKLPRVLIVHIKRFDYYGSKLNFNLEFPQNFSF